MSNKVSLRKSKIQQRNQLSQEDIRLWENKILLHFSNFLSKKNLRRVSVYLDINNEVPTKKIIRAIFNLEIECYVPVINKNLQNKKMTFSEYNSKSHLKKNKFGIQEPLNNSKTQGSELDLVIMPLVAFDNLGYRLGMGKGYYDFTFSNSIANKPLLIGLSYDFQEVDSCYSEDHDIRMDALISPSGIRQFI
tara:strand:- start:1777 stop:2352 length:576 start_codon:yes stop_codon:yes gene_type:complete